MTVEVTGKDNTVGSVRRYSLGDDDNGKPLILAEEVGFYFSLLFGMEILLTRAVDGLHHASRWLL